MPGQKRSTECERLVKLYAQSVEDLAKAAASLRQIVNSLELDAFLRAWRLCEQAQSRCREIHGQLYRIVCGQPYAIGALPPNTESILIVDDQVMFRRGLRHTLAKVFSSARLSESCKGKEAAVAVSRHPWDIVILHVALLDRTGLDFMGETLRQTPQIRILVLLDRADERYARRLMRMGASGYISKDAPPGEMIKAVRTLLINRKYPGTKAITRPSLKTGARRDEGKGMPKPLSDRERQIAIALASGSGLTETARDLKLSVKTASTYKRRILNKLQLDSTAELVRYSIEHNLF